MPYRIVAQPFFSRTKYEPDSLRGSPHWGRQMGEWWVKVGNQANKSQSFARGQLLTAEHGVHKRRAVCQQ